jgi:branched-subunit amino acid aminotransferase/4-amino-4-deoxychorismate lyase
MMIRALVDGYEADSMPIADSSVIRGDGCFEAVRSYRGSPYALGWHLDRLERSARLLGIPTPDRDDLEGWCRTVAKSGDGVVRVLLTRGNALPGDATEPRCVVMFHDLPGPVDAIRAMPVTAPWHPGGIWSELAGAKTLSYAPNLAAQRTAKAAGFDDALLVSATGTVLEFPTASVGWVIDDVIETPSLDLYILDSITRRTMIGLADGTWPVREGRFDLDRAMRASEIMVMSTVKEIIPVIAVGDRRYEPGPVTTELGARFRTAVEAGWGD